VAYELGRGVAKNEAEAARWYRKAADRGAAVGALNLARLYNDGRGVPKDDAQASAWYVKSAELGDPDGQFYAGLRYADGIGIAANPVEAYKWMSLGVARSSNPAAYAATLKKLESRLTPEQLAAARNAAQAWQQKFAATQP